jgi:hypothetical protein
MQSAARTDRKEMSRAIPPDPYTVILMPSRLIGCDGSSRDGIDTGLAGLLPSLPGCVARITERLLCGQVVHGSRGAFTARSLGGQTLFLEGCFACDRRRELLFLTLPLFFGFPLALLLQQTLPLGLTREPRLMNGLSLSGNSLTPRVVRSRPCFQFFDKGQLGR